MRAARVTPGPDTDCRSQTGNVRCLMQNPTTFACASGRRALAKTSGLPCEPAQVRRSTGSTIKTPLKSPSILAGTFAYIAWATRTTARVPMTGRPGIEGDLALVDTILSLPELACCAILPYHGHITMARPWRRYRKSIPPWSRARPTGTVDCCPTDRLEKGNT